MENQELKTRIENWIQSIDGKLITDESCEMLDHLIENGFFDEVKVTDLTSHLFEEGADEFEEWAKCHSCRR